MGSYFVEAFEKEKTSDLSGAGLFLSASFKVVSLNLELSEISSSSWEQACLSLAREINTAFLPQQFPLSRVYQAVQNFYRVAYTSLLYLAEGLDR